MSKDTRQELGWEMGQDRRVMDNFGIWTLSRFLEEWKMSQGRQWWWRDNFKSQPEEFRLWVGRYLEIFVYS